ncbi:MAG: DNA topoisomerase, partial [Candidatus Ornithospirochaeta sp.]
YKGKTERLWISSQTEKAIKEGFASLRPSSDYDNLYRAAECRAAADWYVGMNVTRALTCRHDAKLSAGRVQTPTLALMTEREDEIDAFLGSFYYTCRADFGYFAASYYPEASTVRFTGEEKAEEMKALKGKKGRVIRIEKEEKRDPVPLAYDLTELQRDANTALGFSAKETLDTLQRLYEVHKLVTYPRTDSRYITPDIVPTIPDRIRALQGTIFSRAADEYLSSGFVSDNPRFVDETQVSDHHAIIPTEEKVRLEKLTTDERRLWELIALRFLEVIGNDYVYSTTTIDVDVDGNIFRTRQSIPLQKGYRSVSESCGLKTTALSSDDGDETLALSGIKEGIELEVIGVKVRKSSTVPPERYTDATLLSAMEHAGRFVDDKDLKMNLTSGLGTPATRADIIEKLVQNRYVDREGKYFVPTAKGREVVRLAPDVLKSPELTGRWEGRLEAIAKGKEDPSLFIKDIKKMASSLVDEVSRSSLVFAPSFKDGKTCPYCGGAMMRAVDSDQSVHYICQKLSCQYEEREYKVKVSTGAGAPTKTYTTTPDGKIKVVVKKGGTKVPAAIYETKTEVVRESKRKYRESRSEKNGRFSEPRRDSSYYSSSSSSSGGTMADFFLLSKKREEERRDRKKGKK